jgi:hypothetical protein
VLQCIAVGIAIERGAALASTARVLVDLFGLSREGLVRRAHTTGESVKSQGDSVAGAEQHGQVGSQQFADDGAEEW